MGTDFRPSKQMKNAEYHIKVSYFKAACIFGSEITNLPENMHVQKKSEFDIKENVLVKLI